MLIEREAHFLHILHYIHLNPLDFLSGADEWRSWEVEDAAAALAHLDAWRWSSYRDYSGTRNFPSILETSLFGEVFGNYRETITAYMKNLELAQVEPLMLE